MNKSNDFQYSGTDNLEVMKEAVNYNLFLSNLVDEYCAGAKNVVDFGAGIGTFSAPLHNKKINVIAVEPDENQRRSLDQLGIANVQDISMIEDGWADAIYSINVLEHIENDEIALRHLYSKLKPGGKVFIYVPAFQLLYSSMDKKVGHFRRYKRAELSTKMIQSGLEIIDSRYADSLGFIASFIFKYIGNDSGDLNITAIKIFDRYIFPASRMLDNLTSPWFGKNLIAVARRKQ